AGQGDRAGAVTRPASLADGPDRESPAMEADGAYTPGERPTTAADFDYRLIDSAEALAELAASLAGVGLLSVDTETTSTRPVWAELVGISLAWRTGVGYYVPIRGPMGAKVLDTQLVRSKLGPILADPNVRKVGHNLKYDCIVLARAGMPLKGIHFDTYLAARLLDADAPGKLDDVAMRMLNHRCIPISDLIGSGARAITMDQVPTDIVATYAAEDAEVTLRLTEALQSRLQDEQLAGLLGDVELPLLTVLAEMELAGVRVDRQELKRQAAGLGKQADALRDRIMVLAGEPFNPDSPKQLAEILFGKFKLPVLKKTKTGPSTDADVLEELGVVHELPAVVLEYRQLTKLLGTYLGSLAECIFPGDGRVHASFNQAGTVTGRLSSSSPNLQNIPIRSEVGRRIRAAFVAEPGWVLLSADYSQVELRILAHLCQDATLMAAFAADEDIHRIVAAEVFAVPAEDVTPEQRARAKTVNFGIIYGQTAHGLARTLRIGRTEAQEFITAYKGRFPAIEAFLAECVEQAKRCGYVETILNRRRAISEIASRNAPRRAAAERMAINSVVQGSAADLIKLAMVNIHRRISAEGRPSRMLLQIHDELVFEIPQADLPAEQAMVVEEMTSAMTLRVPLKVDTGTGVNWMQAK
ncbi:MAG: DNA polymerase I, partial [Planctomycetes bacterium]|nr:DNA polymerase I [Planctomycetota bacterium]